MRRAARAGLWWWSSALALAACDLIVNADGVTIIKAPAVTTPPPLPQVVTACEPGTARCSGAALQLCEADSQRFRTARVCATAGLCCAGPECGGEGCRAPVCSPGDYTCAGSTLRACNESQDGWVDVDTCTTALHCDAEQGRCTPEPCVPGTSRCQGASLMRCGELGWSLIEECGTPGLCKARTSPEACAEAGCRVENASTPSPFSCDDGDLLRCSADQLAWEHVETCLNPTSCNGLLSIVGDPHTPILDRRDLERLGCSGPSCTPGSHECRDGGLYRCNPDRTGYLTLVAQCASPGRCDAAAATCRAEPCVDGDLQCSGAALQRCEADAWVTEERCASAAQCTLQGCEETLCTPMEYSCEERALRRCNTTGTAWIPVQTCATSELCDVATKRCAPPVCQPGQRRCNTRGQLEECKSGLDGWDVLLDCAAMAGSTVPSGTASSLCDPNAGACSAAPSCPSGAFRCNAELVERCDGAAWRPHARCTSAALCDATTGDCREPVCQPGTYRCRRLGATQPAEPDESTLDLLLEVCEWTGERYVLAADCRQSERCDAEHGQCDICNASQPGSCVGDEVHLCSADGQERTLDQVCSDGCTLLSPGRAACLDG